MAHLIVGDGADAVLAALSGRLRAQTLALCNSLDGRDFSTYSPLMAGRPVWPEPAPDLLLEAPRETEGEVIVARDYLQALTGFLDAHPDLLVELIGSRDDWSICESVRETRQPMIAALIDTRNTVVNASPFFAGAYNALIQWIVPLQQPRPRGWSLQNARGMIFLGFQDGYDATNLALDLVHEMGHQALALFQSADPIFVTDPRAPVYSEVRKTYRPAIQSLHAAAAIAFMTRFLADVDKLDHHHPDFHQSLPDTLERAVATLRKNCEFTPVGAQILEDFAASGSTH